MSLFSRKCSVDLPTRDICIHFLNLYIVNHVCIDGTNSTLIDRIVKMGISPVGLLSCPKVKSSQQHTADGLVDSLRAMLYDNKYVSNHGRLNI